MPERTRVPSRALITILDAALIVTASAALVILLGGRTRLFLGATRITVRSPLNAAIVAAVLAAVRLAFGGRMPLLPSLRRGTLASDAGERRRFACPEPITRDVIRLGLASVLGSLVWIWPHLMHLRSVPDPFDPVFSAWRIARLAHQLAHDPAHLFDGNIFYPLSRTLTLSDATLLQGFIGAPFVWAGADPLVVANALFLLAFPACGVAFFYAAWRLTGDPRAALVASMIGAWYPFHGEHYSHLELQYFMFMPLAIVFLLRLVAAPGRKTAVPFAAAVALQWLACMYFGVMLVTVLLPFGAVMLLAWRPPLRRLAGPAALAALIIAVVVAAEVLPYLRSDQTRGERHIEEIAYGSAVPADYGQPHRWLANYTWLSREGAVLERQLLPGISTVALAAAGLVPPVGAAAIGVTISTALAFDWSLGLNGLTYDDLHKYVLPYRGMRVPARFDALVGSLLALLAAWGARRLIRLAPGRTSQSAVCAALTLLVIWDLRIDPALQAYYPSVPSIYRNVTPSSVLAEFPMDRDIDFMYFSTRHWAHLLGGYSGFPLYSPALVQAWRTFPDPSSIAQLRALGATHLTYNCTIEPRKWRCGPTMRILDANPMLELVAREQWMGGEVRLYRYR